MGTKLALLGNAEPAGQILDDAEAVSELRDREVRSALEAMLEGSPDWLLGRETSVEFDQRLQQHVPPERLEPFKSLTAVVVRGAAKYDLGDGVLRSDLETLGLSEAKVEAYVGLVGQWRDPVRDGLARLGGRTALPQLRDVRWKVSTDRATPHVRGTDRTVVYLTLVLDDGDELEEVTVEIPEENLDGLSMLSSAIDEVSGILGGQ